MGFIMLLDWSIAYINWRLSETFTFDDVEKFTLGLALNLNNKK